jgi:guanosine-3',5'-bis(diphosphate) 3'-pyrophosphohydrolase
VSVSVLVLGGRRAGAIRFLIDAYNGIAPRPGKGIPHPQAVADILREVDADEVTQVVGLLHDVVEDTARSVGHVGDAFGDEVAEMVAALTEDESVAHYAPRKRVLRARIAAYGSPVVDVALADKIASLRHALVTDTPVSKRKLGHYRATLRVALAGGEAAPLCGELEDLLLRFP